MTRVDVLRAGDGAWLLELPDDGSAPRVASRLVAEHGERLVDVVPGHRTVLAVGDLGPDELLAVVGRALAEVDAPDARTFEIPVTYDGPDLAEVGHLTGLGKDQIVALHSSAAYVVAFLGFAPGFAYLVGGDPLLQVPRRDEPRERVPGGSVAIAGPYSGIYPRASPGGWRLIGHTELALFDVDRRPPALLAAGDHIRFVPLP
jgi:KipI family sensor histidine kinase inhibitor